MDCLVLHIPVYQKLTSKSDIALVISILAMDGSLTDDPDLRAVCQCPHYGIIECKIDNRPSAGYVTGHFKGAGQVQMPVSATLSLIADALLRTLFSRGCLVWEDGIHGTYIIKCAA